MAGGSWSDIFRAGVQGVVTGAIAAAIGGAVLHGWGRKALGALESKNYARFLGYHSLHTAGHGVVGGGLSELTGGNFKDGFIGAGSAAFLSPVTYYTNMGFGEPGTGNSWQYLGRTATAATIGGTVTAISGGKFGNGAATAAFMHVVNAEVTGGLKKPRSGKNFLNMFDSDDKLWKAFNAVVEKSSGVYVVGGHARMEQTPFIMDNYGIRSPYSAAELYELMVDHGYAKGSGMPILLYGCETGKLNLNGDSLASQLSIIAGAHVAGASEAVWALGAAPPAIAVDNFNPAIGAHTRGATGYVRWFNPSGKEIVPNAYNPYKPGHQTAPSGHLYFQFTAPNFSTWKLK
jgi:hypothetical protein